MVRIPGQGIKVLGTSIPWFWIAVPVIGMLSVGIRGATQASYFRGIADDAESRLEAQALVLESVSVRADSLAAALEAADSAAVAQRLEAERELAALERSREAARVQAEESSERLRASLNSVQARELDTLVEGYRVQISALEETVAIERAQTASERLRVTQASELVLGLRAVIAEHEESATIMSVEVAALRSSIQPSFGFRLKADWWLAAVGFAAGVAVTR
tara:strand:+ start:4697 stop:5356 length:660 start_codon:yes stop_codon:yes gene_type:complete